MQKQNKKFVPWNKGLTKETSKKIAETSEYLRRNRVSRNCNQCNKKIVRAKWAVIKNVNNFCNRECWKNYRKGRVNWLKKTQFQKGMSTWNKGKNMIYSGSFKKNHGFTKEMLEKMRQPRPAMVEYFIKNPKAREIRKANRLKQIFPKKDSKPEKKIQSQLQELNIGFEKHKPIIGQPDIYIPEKNLIVFIDGCWNHACHECQIVDKYLEKNPKSSQAIQNKRNWYRDFRIKHDLELEGYNVIRLWEHDIRKPEFNIKGYL